MSQLLDVLFGGGAESPLDRIIRQNGFTPGINPTASHPLTTLPGNNPSAEPAPMPNPLQTQLGAPESDMAALARQNNFGGDPVTSNVSDRRISATADRNTRGERGIEKILGAFGGPGRAVRDFISPATNALGTIMDVAEGVAAKGGLSSIAPNFSAGVQAAAQRELEEAYRRAQLQIERDKIAAQALTAGRPQRRVQSAQPLENGNIGYLDAFTGEVVDTGVKAGNRTQIIDIPGKGRFVFDPVESSLTPIATEQEITTGEAGRKAATTEAQKVTEENVASLAEEPQRQERLTAAQNRISSVRETVVQAIDQVNAMTSGFVGSRAAGIAGTPARDLQGDIQTIKAVLGFEQLQLMRELSPTGGALGQVAVQELEALQSTIAELSQELSPGKLRENLEKIKTHLDNWESAIKISQSRPAGFSIEDNQDGAN